MKKLFGSVAICLLALVAGASASFGDISEYCGQVASIAVNPQLVEVYISPNPQSKKLLEATPNGKTSKTVAQRFKKSDFSQESVIAAANASLSSAKLEFCFPTSEDQKTAWGSNYFRTKRSD